MFTEVVPHMGLYEGVESAANLSTVKLRSYLFCLLATTVGHFMRLREVEAVKQY